MWFFGYFEGGLVDDFLGDIFSDEVSVIIGSIGFFLSVSFCGILDFLVFVIYELIYGEIFMFYLCVYVDISC